MSRRTITIDPTLHTIINVVRGFFLMMGKEYNYTEVVNAATFYGICYWLKIPHNKAVELSRTILTSDLKLEGLKDEEKDRIIQNVLSKLEPLPKQEMKSLLEGIQQNV